MLKGESVDFEHLEKAKPEDLMLQLDVEEWRVHTLGADVDELTKTRVKLLQTEITRRLQKLPEVEATLGKLQIELEVCQGKLAQSEAELARLKQPVRFFED